MQIVSNLFGVGWYYMLDILGGYVLESVRLGLCRSVYGGDYKFVLKYGKERLKNTFFIDPINIYSCAVLQSLTIVSNLILLLVYILVTACFSPALSVILLSAAFW